jgi:hypothetical protein
VNQSSLGECYHFSSVANLRRIDPVHLKREQVNVHVPEGGLDLVVAAAQRAQIMFKRGSRSGRGNPSAFLAALLRVVLANDGEKASSLSWRHRDREDDAKAFRVLVETISRPSQLARVAGSSWEHLLQAVAEAGKLREQRSCDERVLFASTKNDSRSSAPNASDLHDLADEYVPERS